MAVRKAVSAATMTFTAISMIRFFIVYASLRLRILCLLLGDPVLERGHLLDVLLLLGVGLFGREVDLLLDAVGGERTEVLEGDGGDVVLGCSLGTEADVDGLHVGGRVPLALEQGCPGDAFLGGLDGGDEGAQTVDLHGVALRQEFCDAARHLHEHALDDVSAVDRVVLGHVLAEAAQRDCLLLNGLGVVLAVARIVRIDVLANVDFKLWILYCHSDKRFLMVLNYCATICIGPPPTAL